MSAEAPISILPAQTPNPASLKFTVNRTLITGAGRDFSNPSAASKAPLAKELFMLPNVVGVFIGPEFITVTARHQNDWWSLQPLVSQSIETFLDAGRPVVEGEAEPAIRSGKALTSVEAGIIRILEDEIRPAVAMDGGDIDFAGFENGILKLHLRGACHSCPSSMFTLKMGIENRMKQEFPEILSVEAV